MINTKKVPADMSQMRLDKVSAELFNDYSRTQIKKWILEGRILLNGELAVPKEAVNLNDEIEINPTSEKKVSWEAEDIEFEVIYENNNFLIINKNPNKPPIIIMITNVDGTVQIALPPICADNIPTLIIARK